MRSPLLRRRPRSRRSQTARVGIIVAAAVLAASCSSSSAPSSQLQSHAESTVSSTTSPPEGDSDGTEPNSTENPDQAQPPSSVTAPTTAPGTPDESASALTTPRPAWLGQESLTDDGSIATHLETPPELQDRRFATIDHLPAPATQNGAPPSYAASVAALTAAQIEESTYQPGCPVPPEQLRYLTMNFWGFDDQPHTGDMIVHESVADDVIAVFHQLYDARYPIEEMRVTTQADLDAPASGDGNVTTAFVCRPVQGSSTISQHAYGLAIDINPFHNPYKRGDIVLPELATHYLDRSLGAPGQILPDGVVVQAFASIGWSWGGNWQSLVDYHHFSLHNK